MQLKYCISLLIPILILLVVAGCEEEVPTSLLPRPYTLITLHLGEHMLQTFPGEGVVFASDPYGNVLDMATWSDATTIVLENRRVPPDYISFTLVRTSQGSHIL